MSKKIFGVSIFALLSLMLFGSCRNDNNQPNPPASGEFKALVRVVDGKLAEMPEPFIDFGKAPDVAKEWEKNYGSTLKNESAGELIFETGDPEKINPIRRYLFADNKLTTSVVELKASLLFAENNEITEEFEKALYDKGYAEKQEKGKTIYTNGIVIVTFARQQNNAEMANIIYTPSDSKLEDGIKDFPLIIAKKAPKDYTPQEIKAYEEKQAIRKLKSETAIKLSFEPKEQDLTKYNIHFVDYNLKDAYDANGSIIARLKNVKNVEVFESETFKKYLKEYGFEFEEKKDAGGYPFILFKNVQAQYRIRATMSIGNEYGMLQFEFDPNMAEPGGDPKPEEWQQFYLPFFDFGAEISENSPVFKKEKDRKFTVWYKPDGNEEIAPTIEHIYASRPFNLNDPYQGSAAKKPGFASFSYTKNKVGDASKITVIQMTFNKVLDELWKKDKLWGEYEPLKTFLAKNGFEFKETVDVNEDTAFGKTTGKMTYYYNSSKKVLLTVPALNSMFGLITLSTFTPADSYKSAQPLTATQIERLYRQR